MAIIWDIILVAVIIVCVSISAKKGFLSASKSILALILTAILITSMQPVVLEFLQSSSLGDNIRTTVSKNITKSYQNEQLPENTDTTDTETSIMICDSLGLPKFMASGIKNTVKQMSQVRNNVMEVITDSITTTIMRVLSVILLFILVRVFVFLIIKILDSLFTLPGLSTINKTLGAVIGIINAVLIIYIICGAVSLIAPSDKLPQIKEVVENTYILKYFYEQNLLLSLFI